MRDIRGQEKANLVRHRLNDIWVEGALEEELRLVTDFFGLLLEDLGWTGEFASCFAGAATYLNESIPDQFALLFGVCYTLQAVEKHLGRINAVQIDA